MAKKPKLSEEKRERRAQVLQPIVDKALSDIHNIPKQLMDDAVQEAWVAALEGKDIKKAVYKFIGKERLWAQLKNGTL